MVRRLIVLMMMLAVWPAAATAFTPGVDSEEPDESQLGAPRYPGAVFIRTQGSLDPYYETALYISLDPMSTVVSYFDRKLPPTEKRRAYYIDGGTITMTIFLLKTWSKFPSTPTRDDLQKLESEENVRVQEYDRDMMESLTQYYERTPDTEYKADAIRTGKTFILYTYRREEADRSSRRIVGRWRCVDRDLPGYRGSIMEFSEDGTYTHTLTDRNLDALAEKYAGKGPYEGMTAGQTREAMEARNPVNGEYVIMRRQLTLSAEEPLTGEETKLGIATVKQRLLSIELANLPRLTFIKERADGSRGHRDGGRDRADRERRTSPTE